jgi:YjjG family noncanonical pyrimidine nucleotidase
VSKYKCILFDLDHTLWDYESNCAEAINDLFHKYELKQRGVNSPARFLESFNAINTPLWDQYDRGEIHRDVIRFERFNRILLEVGVDDYPLSLQMSADYIAESPRKKNLMPFAIEVLDYLHAKYSMYIITNGFDEIQGTKLASAGIEKYFKDVITSEKAGHKKPAKEIFDYTLRQNGFPSHEAIMIGDNLLTDIAGAGNASIDSVFYNTAGISHNTKVTHEITSLKELKSIL